MEVSVFDQTFEKVANVDMLAFYSIKEKTGEAGTFSIWVEANEENMQNLRKQNIIQFQFDEVEDESKRNYVINGSSIYGVVKNGSELMTYVNADAYLLASDSEMQLNNRIVVASVEFDSDLPVEVGVGGEVIVTIPYTYDGGSGSIALDMTDLVDIQASGQVYESVQLPVNGLAFSNAEVSIVDINGTVNVKNLKLQIGQLPSESETPESEMAIKLNNTCWGIITTKIFRDDDSFFGIEVSGFLVEDVLRKRILWGLFSRYDKVQNIFNDMITENLISPVDTDRTLSNIALENQPLMTSSNVRFQKTGGYVLDAAVSLLAPESIWIKGIFDWYKKQIRFYLYKGKDRSDTQSVNPAVVFSDENGMLIAPKYLTDDSNYKNLVLVAGAGEGVLRIFHKIGDAVGWARDELYIDARDLQPVGEDEEPMAPADYLELLEQRGLEKLADFSAVENFDSGVQTVGGYIYGRDYFIGDIVTVYFSRIGVVGKLPIESVTRSGSADGHTIVVSFGKSNMPFSKMVKTKLN